MKTKFFYLSVLLGALSIVSCQNGDLDKITDKTGEDKSAQEVDLKFMSLAQHIEIGTTRSISIPSSTNDFSGETGMTICEFYWGKRRAGAEVKTDCYNMKFHLCYTDWFPSKVQQAPTRSYDEEHRVSSFLQTDINNKTCVELLLAEPAQMSADLIPPIIVDEDETFYGINGYENVLFTTVQGSYYFDPTIGLYGGYKIYIEIDE